MLPPGIPTPIAGTKTIFYKHGKKHSCVIFPELLLHKFWHAKEQLSCNADTTLIINIYLPGGG